MYQHGFQDPDGHIWEVFWMDPKAYSAELNATSSTRHARRITMNKIAPCLWFDSSSRRGGEVLHLDLQELEDQAHQPATATPPRRSPAAQGLRPYRAFELDGQEFTALNGGPIFKFNEAVSLQVNCDNQDELDHYWNKLSEGGDPRAQQCGWLKDKFGVSWQIVPTHDRQDDDRPRSREVERVMEALLQMKKLDIRTLQQAYDG